MRITMFLLQNGAVLDGSALTDAGKFREVDLQAKPGIDWRLFVRPGKAVSVRWVTALKGITKNDNLDDLLGQSSSAVLLAKRGKRIFAITFGHGFQAVDPKLIERGFGLRVAANVISTDGLKTADTRALNRDGRSQKTMLPVASELFALGIEPAEEWVRQLSGTVAAQGFATTASGADSLRLSVKDFSLDDLPDKLHDIMKLHTASTYKTRFGFLDNFIRLDPKDPVVASLDSALAKLIVGRDSDVHFAAPEPFEQLNVETYQLVCRKKIEIDQLDQSEIYDALDQLTLPQDVLRKVHVVALDGSGSIIDKRYPLYDYIQAEIPEGGDRYVLSAGLWFRVSKSYVDEVTRFVSSIEDITSDLKLPPWPKGKDGNQLDEGAYNKKVADDSGYAVLDTKNVQFGNHQKIEICDLLSPDLDLICVKRAARSSTLSHLFSQASVSASLMNEPKYQDHLTTFANTLGLSAKFDKPSDWRFVYAIALKKPGSLADALFFFSQVNLVTHVKAIESRGFKVALAKVEMQ